MISRHYGKYEDDDGDIHNVSIEDCYFDQVTEDEVERRVENAFRDRSEAGKPMTEVHFVVRPKSVWSISF